MKPVMVPNGSPTQVRHMDRIEVEPLNGSIVDDNGVVSPSRMPTPPTPATPAAAKKASNRYSGVKEEARILRRVIPPWIGVIHRRSPDPERIVHGHVNHIWIGGSNNHYRLTSVHSRDHLLLRR